MLKRNIYISKRYFHQEFASTCMFIWHFLVAHLVCVCVCFDFSYLSPCHSVKPRFLSINFSAANSDSGQANNSQSKFYIKQKEKKKNQRGKFFNWQINPINLEPLISYKNKSIFTNTIEKKKRFYWLFFIFINLDLKKEANRSFA